MKTSFMMTATAAIVYIDGQKYIFSKEHPNFERAKQAVNARRWDLIPELVDLTKAVKSISDRVTVIDGVVFFDGAIVPQGYIVEKLGKMADPKPLALFLERYASNPSAISREEAIQFFDRSNLPLTPDGRFYAWKVVRDDYRDKHSNSFDNSIGQVLSMPREKVDDNRHRTCSYGFHVCSKGYIGSFHNGNNDRLMKVVVDPADIVSIPSDHGDQKMRVCKYEVVAEETVERVDDFERAGVRYSHDDYDAPELAPLEIIAAKPMTFFQTVKFWLGGSRA